MLFKNSDVKNLKYFILDFMLYALRFIYLFF